MKIALIVPGGVDRSGQVRVIPALLWLITRLAQRHQVQVVALRQEPKPSRYQLLGAEIINLALPGGSMGRARAMPGVTRALAAFRPDVIHALFFGSTGLPACFAGRFLQTPVLLSVGGGELVWLPDIGFGGQGRLGTRLQTHWALRCAAGVTAGSRFVARTLPPHLPSTWIPLGIDFATFAASVMRPPGLPWRLLHVASINRVKDPSMLLDVLRQVCDSGATFHLDWIGEDTLNGAIQRQAEGMGLASQVTFHGFQPSHVVHSFARQAHLYLQSSRFESQGVALLEAAAAGVPTVGTAVGLIPELAPNAAVAVPVGDAAAMAQAVLALLDYPALRAQLGAAAQAWASHYDADWTALQFEQLYSKTQQ